MGKINQQIKLVEKKLKNQHVKWINEQIEFGKINNPSLIDVVEVPNYPFDTENLIRVKRGYTDVGVNLFDIEDGQYDPVDLNRKFDAMYGHMSILQSTQGEFKTLIVLNKHMPFHRKMIVLLHELGHVHDFENRINFQLSDGVISANGHDAEAYANIYAMRWLCKYELIESLNEFYKFVQQLETVNEFYQQVARSIKQDSCWIQVFSRAKE